MNLNYFNLCYVITQPTEKTHYKTLLQSQLIYLTIPSEILVIKFLNEVPQ